MNKTKHRGKPRVKTYVYQEDGEELVFDSLSDAAAYTKENHMTVRGCAKDTRLSRKGFLYSKEKLPQETVEKMFDERREETNKKLERFNSNCKEFEGKYEYEVECSERLVTWIPRNRKEKVEQLRKMIYNGMQYRWMIVPKQVAALEKRAYKELLKSLE